MSARDKLHARLFQFKGENRDDMLDAYRAEVRAERDAEIIAWLLKKAREYPTAPERQESAADAIARMADKIARGAVRTAASEAEAVAS